jgi:hypothetical protein
MRSYLLTILAAATASVSPTVAQEQNSEIIQVSPDMFLRWHGHAYRTYFVQISDPNDHLRKWIWAPIIETGSDENISYEVDGTADKGFFRLWFSDQATTDPDGDDFDRDGLTNLDEVTLYQTNPLDSDTDGDGLLDGWEVANSLDPNDDGTTNVNNGGSGDPDNDGLTNAEEQDLGTDPSDGDSDDDGITDGGENDQGTDPNDPEDTPDAEWFILTGDLEVDVTRTRSRTVSIPAGQKCLIVVAVASEEYPDWTGDESEFNDTLSWNVTPAGGQALTGSLDVNSRHGQWEDAELEGVEIQGFSPAHVEAYRTYTAPAETSSSIPMELSATNIGDGALPSTVMVGVFPLKIVQHNMPNVGVAANSTDLGGAREEEEVGVGGQAYITGEPAIPQLRVDFRGAPEAVSVEWRLDIRTERPTLRNTLDDRNLPATGFVTHTGDEEWDIGAALNGEFVGGECTLHYRINGDHDGEAEFYLRGKNPLDADARAQIDATVGANFQDYAWAMAKHESRQGNRVYNQFNTQATIEGTLNFGGPNGWGLCQIDRTAAEGGVTPAEVWNWHQNVTAMLGKLNEKRDTYNRFIGYFRDSYGQQANWSEPPAAHTIGNTTLPAEAWGVMVLYNGADGGVPVSAPPSRPQGFRSPWVFNPANGSWTFHDNSQDYAAGRVRPELERTVNTNE